ncbi:hypothetical protein [Botrimarina colliarenosi]|nr:hypothetical protein [Botrimarina colliarenosi]
MAFKNCWLAMLMLPLCIACSRSPFDADVAGTITLDGSPVAPGVVIFSPMERGKNSSRGMIDAQGGYHLVTQHERGVHPGEYQVAVLVYEKGDPPGPGERAPANLPALVPEKYLDVKTSELTFDVAPGRNTIDIELTSN